MLQNLDIEKQKMQPTFMTDLWRSCMPADFFEKLKANLLKGMQEAVIKSKVEHAK